jgi:hypothetical protein
VNLAVRLPSLAVAVALASCSLGEGQGQIEADDLYVTDCFSGPFRLDPDFFAAQPYRQTVSLRIQHGSDTEEVSDGAIILVDDVNQVRSTIDAQGGSATFRVDLPPAVVPPGYPVVADPDPAIVHLTLYLHRACHAQNGALYSVGGDITFRSLFNNNLNETDDAKTLTDASFTDITVADPRDRMPGTNILLHETHLRGNLSFHFRRGQPAQPFP